MTPDQKVEKPIRIPVDEKVRVIQDRIQPITVREEQVPAYIKGGFRTGFEVSQVAVSGDSFLRYEYQRGQHSRGSFMLVDAVLQPGYVGLYIRNVENSGLDNSFVATHSDWSRLRRAIKGRLRNAGYSQQMPGFRF